MDDDLEGRAREREAPSAERGFPKTLFFFSSRFLAQFSRVNVSKYCISNAGFPRGRGGGIGFERQTSERGW